VNLFSSGVFNFSAEGGYWLVESAPPCSKSGEPLSLLAVPVFAPTVTKPVGVGIYSAAFKKSSLAAADYADMIATMTRLNRIGAELAILSPAGSKLHSLSFLRPWSLIRLHLRIRLSQADFLGRIQAQHNRSNIRRRPT
jgi:hypothetical protein